MDFETILWIVISIIWVALSGWLSKRTQENAKKKKPAENKGGHTEPVTTIEDILREIKKQRKAVRERRDQQKPFGDRPAPVVQKQVSNKQEVVKDKVLLSKNERRSKKEYDAYLKMQQRKEHDAMPSQLEKKILQTHVEEEDNTVDINISLRDIVIADAILNRPYD